jgi:uncharacterized membrane protein YdjX (TVP38/TMEM64 family)
VTGAIGAIVVVVMVGVVAWKLAWGDYERAARLAHRLRAMDDPSLAALTFIGAWTLGGSLGFPALPLMLTGGLLFGTLFGTVLNLAGTALGASGGYGIARALARGPAREWLGRHLPVRDMSNRRGFLAVARFRLLPIVPLAVGNFAAGLARMGYWPYLGGTLIGQLPSIVIYTYFADAIVRAASAGTRSVAARDVIVASAALLLVSFLPWIVARRQPNK